MISRQSRLRLSAETIATSVGDSADRRRVKATGDLWEEEEKEEESDSFGHVTHTL